MTVREQQGTPSNLNLINTEDRDTDNAPIHDKQQTSKQLQTENVKGTTELFNQNENDHQNLTELRSGKAQNETKDPRYRSLLDLPVIYPKTFYPHMIEWCADLGGICHYTRPVHGRCIHKASIGIDFRKTCYCCTLLCGFDVCYSAGKEEYSIVIYSILVRNYLTSG